MIRNHLKLLFVAFLCFLGGGCRSSIEEPIGKNPKYHRSFSPLEQLVIQSLKNKQKPLFDIAKFDAYEVLKYDSDSLVISFKENDSTCIYHIYTSDKFIVGKVKEGIRTDTWLYFTYDGIIYSTERYRNGKVDLIKQNEKGVLKPKYITLPLDWL